MAAQICSYVTRLGSTLILARLLRPADFGLLAMVVVVTNFAILFKDMGLTTATIQRKTVTHEQVSGLFWINLVISSAIGLILISLAPAVAWFYEEPRLLLIVIALSFTYPLEGLTLQHSALLHRQMRFKTLGVLRMATVFVSSLAGITAALIGLGYWSLVIMQLVNPLWYIAIVWFVCPWRPSRFRRGVGLRDMVTFGGHITGFNFINYFSRNADNLLIGKVWGKEELGLYSKAYDLLLMPIRQIRNPMIKVATPAMSRLTNDSERYAAYYYKLTFFLAFLSMPITVFLAVCAEDVILLVLGNQWLDMADIFSILAITSIIQTVESTRGVVLISTGQGERYLKWGLISALVTVSAFGIGVRWGGIGVATAYCIANYLLLLPSLWYCFKNSPVNSRGFIKSIFGPLFASLAMGGTLYLINYQTQLPEGLFIRIMTNLLFAAFIYILILFSIKPWRGRLVTTYRELAVHLKK